MSDTLVKMQSNPGDCDLTKPGICLDDLDWSTIVLDHNGEYHEDGCRDSNRVNLKLLVTILY